MKIIGNSILFIKENFFCLLNASLMTARQKKIGMIVVAALSCLALCYSLYRRRHAIPILTTKYNTLMANNKRKEAEEPLKKILEIDPNNAFALDNMGWLYSLDKSTCSKAIPLLKKHLAIQPHNLNSRIFLGNAYLSTGALDEAKNAFEEYLKLRPDNALVHNDYFEVGRAYLDKNEPDKAKEIFEKILEIAPDNAQAKEALDKRVSTNS